MFKQARTTEQTRTEADTRLAPNYGVIDYANQLQSKEVDFEGRVLMMQEDYAKVFEDADDTKANTETQTVQYSEVLPIANYRGILQMDNLSGYRNKTKFTFGYDKDALDITQFGLIESDSDDKKNSIHSHIKVGFISGEFPTNYIVDPMSVTTPIYHSNIAQTVEGIIANSYLKPFMSPPRLKKTRSRNRKENKLRKLISNSDSTPLDLSSYSDDIIRSAQSKTIVHHGTWKYLTVRTSVIIENTDESCVENSKVNSMVILTNFVRYIDETNRVEYEEIINNISKALLEIGVDIFVVTEYSKSLEPQYDDPIRIIFDRTHIEGIIDRLCSAKFKVSPFSFFQINNEGAQKMYDAVYEMLDSNVQTDNDNDNDNDTNNDTNNVLIDLYCGTGTIGLYLEVKGREMHQKSNYFSKVIGIDCVESSIADAEYNALLNEVTNTTFITAKCEDSVPFLKKEVLSITTEDIHIIVDPSRDGMNKKLIRFLADLVTGTYGISIKSMIYCSCNVHSWKQDIVRLQKEILKALAKVAHKELSEKSKDIPLVTVSDVLTIDMFPHTNHYEVVSKIMF
jgi:tRNA/tmRNA/rRNA uracil-C5-methylase (TrmA/RlmC/RlmD family)